MRIVFCIYDAIATKMPLQPWLTIRHIAQGLAHREHEVFLLSDVAEPAWIEGVESRTVASLRGSNATEVRTLLATLKPEALVFLPTPLNIATTAWLDDIDCRRVGFVSYPFYNTRELLTAALRIGWMETWQYLRHLLVPRFAWSRALMRRLHSVIVQSATTTARLHAIQANAFECKYIPPGIDLEAWPIRPRQVKASGEPVQLLYLGAAINIRGFDIVLDALVRIKNPGIRLRVLARGASTDAVNSIHANIIRRGLAGLIEVEGGWISHAQLVGEIHAADVVLQPFVLVPSELPVTAMEVIACGTPVIGSAIDGLPSTIGPAGTVVQQGSAAGLATAIQQFVADEQLQTAWREGCLKQRNEMLDWVAVTDRWEAVLRG